MHMRQKKLKKTGNVDNCSTEKLCHQGMKIYIYLFSFQKLGGKENKTDGNDCNISYNCDQVDEVVYTTIIPLSLQRMKGSRIFNIT